MYKVLLVDDEYFSREAMKCNDWEALGCQVCGEASNGYAGLEKAMDLRPDIVLADINMPFMDGLEMIAQMKEFLPDAIYAIITGYSEFEYARRGIDLGVEHFIVKPVNDEELGRMVQKMTRVLDERAAKQEEYRSLLFWAQKNAEENRKHFMEMLLMGQVELSRERFLRECHNLHLPLQEGGYGVCQLRFDPKCTERCGYQELEAQIASVFGLERPFRYGLYDAGDGRIYLLFSGIPKGGWDKVTMRALMQRLQLRFMQEFLCETSVGVGDWCDDYQQLPAARTSAERAVTEIATSKLIAQMLAYIHANYADSDLTVTSIAKALFANYSYLSAQFAREIGMTASQYILRFRMNKAADALRAGKDNMVQIAMAVGYTDVKYFYRCFKREFGVTPYQYLERQQNNIGTNNGEV